MIYYAIFATVLTVTEGRPLGGSLRRVVRGEQAPQHHRSGQFHFCLLTLTYDFDF